MGGFRKEKAYEKYSWVLLLVLGMVGLIFASVDMFSGTTDDPQSVKQLTGNTWEEIVTRNPGMARLVLQWVRATGVGLLGASILLIAIASVAYRRGEKWTWYALWIAPIVMAGYTANNFLVGGSLWPFFIALLIVALLGLLLPYRKFFPKKQPG